MHRVSSLAVEPLVSRQTMKAAEGGPIVALALSPDDSTLVSVSTSSNTIELWDPATGRSLKTLSRSGWGDFKSVVCSRTHVALAAERAVFLWNMRTAEDLQLTQQYGARRLAFSADGNHLFAAVKNSLSFAWTLSGEVVRQPDLAKAFNKGAFLVAAGGDTMATVSRNKVQLVSGLTGKKIKSLEFPQEVVELALSGDGRVLFTNEAGGRLCFRAVENEAVVCELMADEAWPRQSSLHYGIDVSFSTDRYAAILMRGPQKVLVVDLKQSEPPRIFKAQAANLTCIAIGAGIFAGDLSGQIHALPLS